ncbi:MULTISPECIES: hypothetical protein [Streptomyces]|uniref:Uncharacterized protein n=1 Tax=Streptomyces doudnae TaxID=3075536 RepID=A0ABD5EQ43_9ACTN|nr:MULTISPECIES: hypothetical protein [unclassified Streptomyces]MDT0436817.1 hypothetical protein [Streptomyces sp. DSM 41981]SCD43716.1 hypothetical protein GA0115242_105234 [Streptomyces sp. SolWspMP-5a-2]
MLRHISERYARGLCAAVVAVAMLVLAANAVPARAVDGPRTSNVQQAHHAG